MADFAAFPKMARHLVATALLLLPGTECPGTPTMNYAIDGQVLDVETATPIAGAMVVANWRGAEAWVLMPRDSCYHSEMQVSDMSGKYHFRYWTTLSAVAIRPELTVYKQGYQYATNPLGYYKAYDDKGSAQWRVHPTAHPNEVLEIFTDEISAYLATLPMNQYMKADVTSVDERFEYVARVPTGPLFCEHDTNQRELYPYAKALYKEAKAIAHNPKQLERVRWLQQQAARVWLASEPKNPSEDPLRLVPREICLDLDGAGASGTRIVTHVSHPDGTVETSERFAREPPC